MGRKGVETASTQVRDEPEARSHARLPAPRLAPIRPFGIADAGYFRSADFFVRLSVLSVLVVAAMAALFLRLWSLEVIHAPEYTRTAVGQATRVVVRPGPRGEIVDARGRPLADTQARSVVSADPRALGSVDDRLHWHPSPYGRRVLAELARLSGVRVGVLTARIRAGLERSPYTAPIVVPRATNDLADYLLERQRAFAGLSVGALPERRYPQGALGGEFLGLVGEIGPQQLSERRYRGYRPGDLIGQSGVESTYDRLLNGGRQSARVVVDALGRPVGGEQPLHRKPPRGLRLTIDARVQRAAERALRDGIGFARANGHADADAGAAVVMNPRTGAIDALASYPGFNQVAAARSSGYLTRLLASGSAGTPLLDRATQGLYPPGSTFKPIVAEAALASGLIGPDTVLPCTGSLTVGNTVFHNVEPGINASLTLPQALAISCDTWFYRLGVDFYSRHERALEREARRLGIGSTTGVDLPGEVSGLVPAPVYAGDSVNLSIGQGRLLVTPLQLAVAYSALANGGTIVRPHVADAVLSPSGRVLRQLRFPPRRRLALAGLQTIRDGLYRAAHDPDGTSTAIFGRFSIPVAGKTGTAQAPSGSDDSWYASWAPAAHPRVVVVVLIEHGGFGAEAAAPAAKEIYSAFFGLGRKGG